MRLGEARRLRYIKKSRGRSAASVGGYDGSWQLGCVGAMWLMHAHVVLVYNTSSRACQNIIQEGRVFRTMRGVAMRMPQEAHGVGT